MSEVRACVRACMREVERIRMGGLRIGELGC